MSKNNKVKLARKFIKYIYLNDINNTIIESFLNYSSTSKDNYLNDYSILDIALNDFNYLLEVYYSNKNEIKGMIDLLR